VDWVTENIEATDELAEPAAFTLARGRGSRVTLTLALASELGLPAEAVLARSRLVADVAAPTPPQELDDFGDTLIGFRLPAKTVYVDLRLRHAAFGYVPPGLDGARTLGLEDATFGVARSSADADRRTIDMTIRLDERGGGSAVATEELAGWPALEWAELVDRFGADRVRLREDFEQRWLGVQFPGARLRDLEVDLPRDASGRVGTARVRYSFVSAHLAVPVDRTGAGARELRIEPTFFRSQPGRRFAAEPQRSTALMLGFDVPTRMTATVELPVAARLDGPAAGGDLVVARAGGYRFVEARDVEPGRPNVIVLRRESTPPSRRRSGSGWAPPDTARGRIEGARAARRASRSGRSRRLQGRDARPGRSGRSPGGGALDRRRQPRSGAGQRSRIAGGRRAGVRAPGPLLARAPRAGARSGHQLDGQHRRHRLDVRAAPQHGLPGRDAGRRRGGRLLVRAADHPRASVPRAGLRLDARLSQHPP